MYGIYIYSQCCIVISCFLSLWAISICAILPDLYFPWGSLHLIWSMNRYFWIKSFTDDQDHLPYRCKIVNCTSCVYSAQFLTILIHPPVNRQLRTSTDPQFWPVRQRSKSDYILQLHCENLPVCITHSIIFHFIIQSCYYSFDIISRHDEQ